LMKIMWIFILKIAQWFDGGDSLCSKVYEVHAKNLLDQMSFSVSPRRCFGVCDVPCS
jgi:hypothetical protein